MELSGLYNMGHHPGFGADAGPDTTDEQTAWNAAGLVMEGIAAGCNRIVEDDAGRLAGDREQFDSEAAVVVYGDQGDSLCRGQTAGHDALDQRAVVHAGGYQPGL